MFQQSVTPESLDQATANAPIGDASAALAPPSTARDSFIDHYFKRIDPQIAASFTDDQCEAIKSMFGARGVVTHSLEIRRSLPIGRRRYYLVLLLGRERRTFGRLNCEGVITRPFNLLGYAITAALWMVPAIGTALLLQAIL
jgi:hypothetical protein